MERKKWTVKEDITESYQKFKDKRKWQLSLRRYVLEKNPSQFYAPYFGLGIEDFRNWIELQFTDSLSWDNFGSAWQFDHIVPLFYFDFENEQDLKLCWNFVNIRVGSIQTDSTLPGRIDVIAVKPYFETLYAKTGYEYCSKMLDKIAVIQAPSLLGSPLIEEFIITNRNKIKELESFDSTDYYNLNKGTLFNDILLEKAIFKKFS